MPRSWKVVTVVLATVIVVVALVAILLVGADIAHLGSSSD
jgi:hypothetical protein